MSKELVRTDLTENRSTKISLNEAGYQVVYRGQLTTGNSPVIGKESTPPRLLKILTLPLMIKKTAKVEDLVPGVEGEVEEEGQEVKTSLELQQKTIVRQSIQGPLLNIRPLNPRLEEELSA